MTIKNRSKSAAEDAVDGQDEQIPPDAGEDAGPAAGPGERRPKLGDAVRYADRTGRQLGIVTRIHGEAYNCVDVAVYPRGGLEPYVVQRADYDPGAVGCWMWPDEAPAAKVPADLLNEATRRGERLPRQGEVISFLVDMGDLIHQHVIARRARVRRVVAPDEVQLVVYWDDKPPADPHAPDTIEPRGEWEGNQSFKRGSTRIHQWEFTDLLPIGTEWPRVRHDSIKNGRCPRCNEPARLPLPSVEVNGRWYFACSDCLKTVGEELSKVGDVKV